MVSSKTEHKPASNNSCYWIASCGNQERSAKTPHGYLNVKSEALLISDPVSFSNLSQGRVFVEKLLQASLGNDLIDHGPMGEFPEFSWVISQRLL